MCPWRTGGCGSGMVHNNTDFCISRGCANYYGSHIFVEVSVGRVSGHVHATGTGVLYIYVVGVNMKGGVHLVVAEVGGSV